MAAQSSQDQRERDGLEEKMSSKIRRKATREKENITSWITLPKPHLQNLLTSLTTTTILILFFHFPTTGKGGLFQQVG